jgi:hypothetical protein
VAVDNGGRAIGIEGTRAGVPVNIDDGRNLVSVSCASTTFCETVDSSGFVVTANSSGGAISSFGDVSPGPGAEEVTLHGSINPNGRPVISCTFEYGTSVAYGNTAPCENAPGSGVPVQVQAHLTGIELRPTYHFRLVAINAGGESSTTDDTFTLQGPPGGSPEAPSVNGAAASGLTQHAAGLSAEINPNGERVTSCTIEYGLTSSYGKSMPCDTALQRLIDAGAAIGEGIRDVGDGIRVATARDPAGSIIGIIENPHFVVQEMQTAPGPGR